MLVFQKILRTYSINDPYAFSPKSRIIDVWQGYKSASGYIVDIEHLLIYVLATNGGRTNKGHTEFWVTLNRFLLTRLITGIVIFCKSSYTKTVLSFLLLLLLLTFISSHRQQLNHFWIVYSRYCLLAVKYLYLIIGEKFIQIQDRHSITVLQHLYLCLKSS